MLYDSQLLYCCRYVKLKHCSSCYTRDNGEIELHTSVTVIQVPTVIPTTYLEFE